MKKVLFLIFLQCMIIPGLNAQNVDSLINVLPEQSIEEKSKTLQTIIGLTYWNDPDTAIHYSEQMRLISLQLADEKAIATSEFYMGVCYYLKSDYNQAIYYYESAYRTFQRLNDKRGISHSLNNLGIIYDLQGDLKTALEYYLESLKIDEEIAPPVGIADSYTNIGVILMNLGNTVKAKEYYLKAYEIYRDTNEYAKLGNALNNLYEIYTEELKWDSALYCVETAIEIYKAHDIKQGLQKAYYNKAFYLEKRKSPDSVLYFYYKSLAVAREISNASGIANALIKIAGIDLSTERINDAINKANEALGIAEQSGEVFIHENAHKVLAEAYEKNEMYDLAYSHLLEYTVFHDSLNDASTKSVIAELEQRYEAEKIEKENRLLKSENELKETLIHAQRTRQVIIICALGLLFIIILVLVNTMRKSKLANRELEQSNREIESQRGELEELNQTKDKLFSIIGHDLRSPVANIKSFMDLIVEESENFTKESILDILNTARDTSSQTLLTLENLLAWARSQRGSFQVNKIDLDLNELIEESFDLVQSIALNKNIQLLNEVPLGTIVNADRDMLNVILRNIVSNALKYTEAYGHVKIGVKDYKNNKLLLSIQDSGIGMDAEEVENFFDSEDFISKPGTHNEKGSGIGLHLCKEFIKKQQEEIWLESKKGEGTSFYISIAKAL